jgi:hypothetical protein
MIPASKYEKNCNCIPEMYERALLQLVEGTLTEAKEAKRQIDSMCRTCRTRPQCIRGCLGFVDRIIIAFSQTQDPNRKSLLLRSLSIVTLHFNAPEEQIQSTGNLIMAGIVDPSGTVREAARNLAGNWRLHDFYIDKQNWEPTSATIKVLTQIKRLCVEHQPEDPVYLDTAVPSVYKSLILLYEDLTGGLYMEQWLLKHPEYVVEIPLRTYEDEAWLTNNIIDRSVVLKNLWSKGEITKTARQALENMESLAKIRFETTMKRLGFTEVEISLLHEQNIHARSDSELGRLCEDVVIDCLNRGHAMTTISTVIRDLQGMTNHTIRTKPHLYTDFILSAASEREAARQKKPDDLSSFIIHNNDVHRAIQRFHDDSATASRQWRDELINRLMSLPKPDENWIKELQKEDWGSSLIMKESCSIAHHAWDWYAQLNPWFTPKTPERHAAITYQMIREMNFSDRQIDVPYSAKQITEFGGWKSQGSAQYPAYSMRNDIIEEIKDIDLFYLLESNPEKLAIPTPHFTDLEDEIFADSPLGEVAPGLSRYIVVLSWPSKELSLEQRLSLTQAVSDSERRGHCILKNITFSEDHVTLDIGIPYEFATQTVVEEIIITTNGLQPFLRFHFLITNTHVPTKKEIQSYLQSLE